MTYGALSPQGRWVPVRYTVGGQLLSIFDDILQNVKLETVTEHTSMQQFEIDELEVRELSDAIEDHFCIDFSPDFIDEAETFGELTKLIATKAGN